MIASPGVGLGTGDSVFGIIAQVEQGGALEETLVVVDHPGAGASVVELPEKEKFEKC